MRRMTNQAQTDEAVDHHLRGVKFRQEERWDEALEAQARALDLKSDLAEAHYEVGVIHLHARRPHEALGAFVRALEADPTSPESHYGRGCAYRQLKRYEDSLDAFKEALRLRPDYALAWEEIGIVHGLLKHFDESVHAFEEALRSEPNNARVHCALGHTYVMMGKRAQAADVLRTLEELDEDLAGLLGAVIANAARGTSGAPAGPYAAISGRNQLRGVVEDVKVEGLLAQVRLRIGDHTLTAIITRDAVEELRLKPGDAASAIIKSTEVMIATEGGQ
jgi:molybdopterin-binding protein